MIMTDIQMGKLAGALAKAQGKITHASKDGLNPAFKRPGEASGTKYATLASVWEACRAALSENEIAVTQAPLMLDGLLVMRTRLMHSSGEFEDAFCPIPVPVTAKAQELGSAITYIRRYSLAAMVGVAPDDDDDGNSANEAGGQKKPITPPKKAEPAQPISAPVNPSTGDVTPHSIALGAAADEQAFRAWGALLAAAVNQSKTLPELEQWVQMNMNTIGKALAQAVGVHARLTQILGARRAALTSQATTPAATADATTNKQ